MTEQRPVDARDALRTDEFRPDWSHALRQGARALKFYLGFLVLCIFAAISKPFDMEAIAFLAGLLAVFGLGSEVNIRRLRANRPILTVGPQGVSFPTNGIDTIGWEDITRVRVVNFRARQFASKGLRFHFRKGRLRRWQFGALGLDRWEIMTSFSNSVMGDALRIQGGVDQVIASIERFHPVER